MWQGKQVVAHQSAVLKAACPFSSSATSRGLCAAQQSQSTDEIQTTGRCMLAPQFCTPDKARDMTASGKQVRTSAKDQSWQTHTHTHTRTTCSPFASMTLTESRMATWRTRISVMKRLSEMAAGQDERHKWLVSSGTTAFKDVIHAESKATQQQQTACTRLHSCIHTPNMHARGRGACGR